MVNVKGRLNSRPFCVAMWSTGKDVQKPASAQLLPCLMATALGVGVAVGIINMPRAQRLWATAILYTQARYTAQC